MHDLSIFPDKTIKPTEKVLAQTLASTYDLWVQIHDFVFEKYPNGQAEWNYPGKKYGWSYRIKDKKRAIIYFMPRDQYFKVASVFGQKTTDAVVQSDVASEIKIELEQARKYAEGRGIGIDIKDDVVIEDIKKLIEIKLAH